MRLSVVLVFVSISILALIRCSNSPIQDSSKDNQTIKEHASTTVALTFSTLSGRLKNAMSEGGVANAVEYCNVNASTLTDSLSIDRNVSVKRVTNRPRNPLNMASAEEMNVFQYYGNAITNNTPYSDTLITYDDRKVYYSPIRINQLCLKCHGMIKDITEYDIIKKHYTDDQAVNYKLGELRGIWSVSYYNNRSIDL